METNLKNRPVRAPFKATQRSQIFLWSKLSGPTRVRKIAFLFCCHLALIFFHISPSASESSTAETSTPETSAPETNAPKTSATKTFNEKIAKPQAKNRKDNSRKRNIPHKVELTPECSLEQDTLRVSFLDVGQGDAVLISCPQDSEHILFDAGDSSEVYPQANEKFLTALKTRLGSDPKISIAIGSHPHPDHIFGFTKLLDMAKQGEISIGRYIDNGASTPEGSKEHNTISKIRDSLASLKIPYTSLKDTPSYQVAICSNSPSAAMLTLRHPGARNAPMLGCPANFNDCSLTATIEFKEFRIQLMGDATSRWEQHAEQQAPYPLQFPVDILMAGHHGANCCSSKFIQRMQPLLTVVSSGLPDLGSNAIRKYPKAESIKILEANARNIQDFKILPEYPLAAYGCSRKSTRCGWTNYSVPTTLLATAQLGTVDIFLQKERICVSAEHLTTGIDFFFSNETLASDLE